jgi:hypothetical protein
MPRHSNPKIAPARSGCTGLVGDIAGLLESARRASARAFPLLWSHYVLLLGGARSPEAREFYHAEALRGGWSVRQLRRQIDSQFYERTALSRNKAKMLARGAKAQPGDAVSADEARLRLCSSAEAPTARVVLSPGQRPGFAPHPQPEALKGRHNPCRNLSPGSKSMWSSARRTASVYWMNRSGPTSTRTWRPS